MGTIIFLCAFLACLSAVLFIAGISMLNNDCRFYKKEMQETDKDILKKEIKFDLILLGICLTSFVIFLSGYLIPTKYYKNTIKPVIKAEYGNVYEYKYSTILKLLIQK